MSPARLRKVWIVTAFVTVGLAGLGTWLLTRSGAFRSAESRASTAGVVANNTGTGSLLNADPDGLRRAGNPERPLDGEPTDPKPVRDALQSVRLGELDQFEALAVAPLFGHEAAEVGPMLSLAEAIRRKVAVVEELPRKQVPTIRIRLAEDVTVLGQSGDCITGGDQDRCIKRDFLIAGKGAVRDIPVYCVEPGRWHGSGRFDTFYCPSNNVAQVNLKSRLLEADRADTGGQGRVWDKVRSNLRGVAASSPSQSIAGVESSSEVAKARDRYRNHFAGFLERHPDALGVAFAAGDQILAIEIFTDHRSLAEKWPALLSAAVVDALQVAETRQAVNSDRVQAFLGSACESNVRQHAPIAAGEEYSLATKEVLGTLLFENGRLLHARLVPQREISLKHEATAGAVSQDAMKASRSGHVAAAAPEVVY